MTNSKHVTDFQIRTPFDFSFEECHWFLDRNHDDCMHTVTKNTVVKPAVISGQKVVFELSNGEGTIDVKILHSMDSANMEQAARDYIVSWLDVNRDLSGFYDVLSKHDRLRYMAKDFHGLRLIGIPDLLEAICWCIIGQQINLAFAYKLKRRMVEQYGEAVEIDGHRYHFFPKAAVLAQLDAEDLKALQFSRQKADYVIHVASLMEEGDLSLDQLRALSDRDKQLSMLHSVRGIGPWTANYVLMKTIKDMNCVTIGDTGLASALELHGLVNDKKDRKEILSFFEQFLDWKSYLNIYLWRSLSEPDFQAK